MERQPCQKHPSMNTATRCQCEYDVGSHRQVLCFDWKVDSEAKSSPMQVAS